MPLTPQQRDAIKRFLDAKATWSTWNDGAVSLLNPPRADVPKFSTIQAAAHYYAIEHGNPYTGDPLWGAGDLYISPLRVQAFLMHPAVIGRPPIDCDDTSGWYWHAVKNAEGVTGLHMLSLVDPSWSFSNRSHVILAGLEHGKAFTLDVNGLAYHPDLAEATLCTHFGRLYGVGYAAAIDTPYPFKP